MKVWSTKKELDEALLMIRGVISNLLDLAGSKVLTKVVITRKAGSIETNMLMDDVFDALEYLGLSVDRERTEIQIAHKPGPIRKEKLGALEAKRAANPQEPEAVPYSPRLTVFVPMSETLPPSLQKHKGEIFGQLSNTQDITWGPNETHVLVTLALLRSAIAEELHEDDSKVWLTHMESWSGDMLIDMCS